MEYKEAIIINNEIRCPICNRKHGEIHGDEVVKNLRVFCKGRTEGKHQFILNLKGESYVHL